EQSAVKLCQEYLKFDRANWIVDPTLCLPPETYRRAIDHETPLEKHMLMYILDHNDVKQDLAMQVAAHCEVDLHSVKPAVTLQQPSSSNLEDYIFPCVED